MTASSSLYYMSLGSLLMASLAHARKSITAFQYTPFEYHANKHRLDYQDRILATHFYGKRLLCAKSCSRNVQCRSFNFCGGRICELLATDVFSTILGTSVLQEDKNCDHFGMPRNFEKVCNDIHNNGWSLNIHVLFY